MRGPRGLDRIPNPLSVVTGLRLRTQYALVLLVILCVLGAVVVGTTELFQQQTVEQEREDVDQTAALAATQIDESITGSQARLRGKSSEFAANLTNDERILGGIVRETEFFIALVTDDRGVVQDIRGDFAEAPNVTAGSNVSDEPAIRAALDGTTSIEEPTVQPDGNITLTMATPISANASIQGVLSGTILLGDDDGIHGGRGASFFRAVQPLNTSVQSAFVEQETNSTVRVHTAGDSFENAITSTATVDSTGWTVQVERDRDALTDRLELLQLVQFGSLLVVLVSVVGLGFYQYRSNLRQTGRLLDGFDRLGGGEFDHRLSFSGAREWEQISDGFNELAAGLREREAAIQDREAQIRERERRLSVLNRVLRHNLQNDVNVIMTQARLAGASDSPDRRAEAVESILDTAEGLVAHSEKARRLETVTENANDDPVTVDLVGAVESLLAQYRRECSSYTVETDLPEQASASAVQGVEFGIETLVENAFEHTDSDDPLVRVSVTSDTDQVHVTVQDNGSGIPEHEQAVLRQPEETSLEHGSGIGLWLAYWSASKSGGELSFGDQSDGGSVTMSLPRADDSARTPAEVSSSSA